jgi:hypothetical protein
MLSAMRLEPSSYVGPGIDADSVKQCVRTAVDTYVITGFVGRRSCGRAHSTITSVAAMGPSQMRGQIADRPSELIDIMPVAGAH